MGWKREERYLERASVSGLSVCLIMYFLSSTFCLGREELRKQADLLKEIREARRLRQMEQQDSNAEEEGESGDKD